MRRRLLLLAAALALLMGQPAVAEEPPKERTCEAICAELAAQNCEEVDSMECNYFVMGCIYGCRVGKVIREK
jgi:hypothetical protein